MVASEDKPREQSLDTMSYIFLALISVLAQMVVTLKRWDREFNTTSGENLTMSELPQHRSKPIIIACCSELSVYVSKSPVHTVQPPHPCLIVLRGRAPLRFKREGLMDEISDRTQQKDSRFFSYPLLLLWKDQVVTTWDRVDRPCWMLSVPALRPKICGAYRLLGINSVV